MKIINISGRDYKMQSSAYTQFSYKDETGRSLIKDLQTLLEFSNTENKKQKENVTTATSEYLEILDNFTEMILKLAYVMIKEADETQTTDYKSFLKSIENIYGNSKWAEEVVTLASTPLLGRLQTNSK